MTDTNFIVTIEKDSDGTFIAYNTDASPYTLIGRGGTVKEAKADFLHSMQEVKASEEEREGAAAPILSAAPVFKFDLSSLFEYYYTCRRVVVFIVFFAVLHELKPMF